MVDLLADLRLDEIEEIPLSGSDLTTAHFGGSPDRPSMRDPERRREYNRRASRRYCARQREKALAR